MAVTLQSLTDGTNEDARFLVTIGSTGEDWYNVGETPVIGAISGDYDLPPLIGRVRWRALGLTFNKAAGEPENMSVYRASNSGKRLFIAAENDAGTLVLDVTRIDLATAGGGFFTFSAGNIDNDFEDILDAQGVGDQVLFVFADSDSVEIDAEPAPAVAPVASFTSVVTDLSVAFTDTSTGIPTSWAWAFGDGATSASQNPTHVYASAGTRTVTLTATNSEGSNTATASVTTTAPDRQPQASTVADKPGTVGQDFSTTLPLGMGGDPPLTYSVSGLPSWASFDPATRVLSGTPDAAGTTTVTYTVQDDDGDTDSTAFDIVISAADLTPLLGAVSDQSVDWGDDLSVTLPAATSGDPPLQYALTGLPSWASFNTATRVLSGTASGLAATSTLTYTATDDDGDQATRQFDLTVTRSCASGADERSCFAWRRVNQLDLGLNGNGGAVLNLVRVRYQGAGGSGVFSPLLALDATSYEITGVTNGTEYTILVRIRNSAGTSNSVAITATPTSSVVAPTASFTHIVSDLTVQFTDTSADAPTSWDWDFGDGTPNSVAQNPTHTYASAGTRTVTLTATNAQGSNSFTASVTVTAPPVDLTPTLPSVADQTGTVEVLFSLTLAAASGGDAPLTYTLTGRPSWLAFNASTRVLSGTPDAAGTHTLTYKVEDDDGDTATRQFDLVVAAALSGSAAINAAYIASATNLVDDRYALAIELVDRAGAVIGEAGIESASISEILDQPGTISCTLPASFARQVERAASFRLRDSKGRVITEGYLTDLSRSRIPGSDAFQISAFDSLILLQQVNTLPFAYESETLTTAGELIESLCRLAGWDARPVNPVSSSPAVDLAGVGVLAGISDICETSGMHFRLGHGSRRLDYGELGEEAGSLPLGVSLSEEQVVNRNEIVNWIVPLIGNERFTITLANANLNYPYPVIQVDPANREGLTKAVYAIADERSIERYGRIEAVVTPDILFTLARTIGKEQRVNVADSLYVWASNYLRRNSVAVLFRAARLAGTDHKFRIGDRVQVDESLMYVVGRNRTWSITSSETTLQLSNIDQRLINSEQIIARALNRRRRVASTPVQIDGLSVSGLLTVPDDGYQLRLVLEVPATVVDIPSARLTLERDDAENGPAGLAVMANGIDIGMSVFASPEDGRSFTYDLIRLFPPVGGLHVVDVIATYGSGILTGQLDATVVTLA